MNTWFCFQEVASWSINSADGEQGKKRATSRPKEHRQGEAVHSTPKHSVDKWRGQRARDSAKATKRKGEKGGPFTATRWRPQDIRSQRLFQEGRVEESKEHKPTAKESQWLFLGAANSGWDLLRRRLFSPQTKRLQNSRPLQEECHSFAVNTHTSVDTWRKVSGLTPRSFPYRRWELSFNYRGSSLSEGNILCNHDGQKLWFTFQHPKESGFTIISLKVQYQATLTVFAVVADGVRE